MLDRLRYRSRRPSRLSPTEELKEGILSHRTIPSASQDVHYQTGRRIRALDINSSRTHVVVAGNKILKTLRVENDNSCSEDYDIREAASQTTDITAAQRETFEIEDVAWSRDGYKDYIATAARNGKIMIYNIERPAVQIQRLHDHLQQVHKVDFSPLEGGILLSASQDGTIRLWDLRMAQNNAMVGTSRETFPSRSGSIRHCKWSPTETWSFAFCTDSGNIQRWDVRNNIAPILNFGGHMDSCNSMDWHPDGKHLVSAGRDQDVRVWNMQGEGVGNKPVFTLRTPYPVQNVRWRPPCIVQDYQEQTYKQCTHFATSYRNVPVIHVWDLRRPLIPFRELHHEINQGTTDMLWRTKDLFWSVGAEGEFSQKDVPYAPKTVERRPTSTLSCAPDGEISFYAKRRTTKGRSMSMDSSSAIEEVNVESFVEDRVPFGRSPGDDSLEENFLTPVLTDQRQLSRTSSGKTSRSFGTTPPSFDDMTRIPVLDFEKALSHYIPYDPEQTAQRGLVPGLDSCIDATYLAQKYKGPPIDLELDLDYILNIRTTFEQNSKYAQRASRYRDAQTWRILGRQLEKELQKRAKVNKRAREATREKLDGMPDSLGRSRATSLALPHSRGSLVTSPNITANDGGSLTHSRSTSPTLLRKPLRRPLSRLNSSSTVNSKHLPESSSNVPTPIVRPVQGRGERELLDISKDDSQAMRLPESLVAPSSNAFLPLTEHEDHEASQATNGSAPEQTSSPADRDGELWRPSGRLPFALDEPYINEENEHQLAQPQRGSVESFEMFSTSSDSDRQYSKPSSLSGTLSRTDSEDGAVTGDHGGSHGHRQDMTELGSPPAVQSSVQYRNSMRRSIAVPQDPQLHHPTHASPRVRSTGEHLANQRLELERLDAPNKDNTNKIPRSFSESFISMLKHPRPTRQYTPFKRTEDFLKRVNIPGFPPPISRVRQQEATAELAPVTAPPAESFELPDFLNVEVPRMENSEDFVTATEMLQRLLVWYIDTADAQMAAVLYLLTTPLLAPPGLAVPQNGRRFSIGDSIDGAYWDHLTSEFLAFTAQAADEIIDKYHRPLDLLGISPLAAEAILSTYHDQLVALNTFNPAVRLRKLAYPAFPSVYEQGLKDIETGTMCMLCKSPINNPWDKLWCESCKASQAECPICLCRVSPFELPGGKSKKNKTDINTLASSSTLRQLPQDQASFEASAFPSAEASTLLSMPHDFGQDYLNSRPTPRTGFTSTSHSQRTLYSICHLCNHGTHAACAHQWFSDPSSGGGCPTPGCICDCTVGLYRDKRVEAMIEEQERQRAEKEKREAKREERRKQSMNAARDAMNAEREKGMTEEEGHGRRVRPPIGQVVGGITRLRGALKTSASVIGAGSTDSEGEGKKVRLVEPSGSAEV